MVEPEGEDLLPTEPEGNTGNEKTIVELKQLKAQAKTVFTRTRRQLLVTIQQDKVTTDEIKEGCEALDIAQEEAMGIMARLLDRYMVEKDNKNSEKLSQEIDNIELEYSEAQNRAQSVFDEVCKAVIYSELVKKLESQKQQTSDMDKGKDDDSWSSFPVDRSLHQPVNSQKSAIEKSYVQLRDASESHLYDIEPQEAAFDQPSSGILNSETRLSLSDNRLKVRSADSEMIGQDLWKQLKRVTIPIFSGDKKTYQNWRAAFMACVDQAPATAEYKLFTFSKS